MTPMSTDGFGYPCPSASSVVLYWESPRTITLRPRGELRRCRFYPLMNNTQSSLRNYL